MRNGPYQHMRQTALIFAALSVLGSSAFSETVSLDGMWSFSKDGGAFEAVRIPHDWAIAGPFNREAEGKTGKLPWKADGEYRRNFSLKEKPRHARLEFDGVMAWPEVFVNGVNVGGWDYGYVGFWCDITDAVHPGDNRLVVKASTKPHKSRWYPGGGIYRSVRLVTDDDDYVLPGSVFIRAVAVTKSSAKVQCDYELSQSGHKSHTFEVANPRLWDVDDPYLYETKINGKKYRYGIRTAMFTADDGFHLNGRRVQLKGVNLHSDLGPIGMAFDRDAAKRQLLLMKDMGANAIRTAHNPPAPQFLDLCDELGFLVWDECFDKWDETAGRKAEQNLEEFVVRNLQQFVRRDRNHPSVICWSIGNEIFAFGSRHGDESSITRGRVSMFREAIRTLDPTRPVALGCASDSLIEGDFLEDIDVCGWNYARSYIGFRRKYPNIPLVYSESASTVSNYGFYKRPRVRGKNDFSVADMQADGFDLTSAWCGDIPDVEFNRVEHDSYLAGEFVWTGIDYLGEPCPFCYIGRPDCWPGAEKPEKDRPRSSYFGIADLCCVPKDRWFLYRAHWNDRNTTVHIASDGTVAFVYASGDEAELFCDGKSLGRRRKIMADGYSLDWVGRNPTHADYVTNEYYRICSQYRFRWDNLPPAYRELTVAVSRNGKIIGRNCLKACDVPERISLSDDPYTPEESRLAFVQIDVVDAAGVRSRKDCREISLRIEGDAHIVAVGNGDPMDFDAFSSVARHKLYYGKAVAYIRRGRSDSTLIVTADGLTEGRISIRRDCGAHTLDFSSGVRLYNMTK